jgi:hypothetical protein
MSYHNGYHQCLTHVDAYRLIDKTDQPAKASQPWLTNRPRVERLDPKLVLTKFSHAA